MARFFSFLTSRKQKIPPTPPLFLTNTLSGERELFVSLKPGVVSMYNCGPTVYARAHIGNLRAYVFADMLRRVLLESGYRLRQVINITDVGHLVGDGDEGEDKIEQGARRENREVEEIIRRYTENFLEDIAALNVETKEVLFPRASEYIKEQIAMVKTLEEKGFAYRLSDGMYFDTGRFPGYGKLGGVHHAELKEGARVKVNEKKRHPADFALWKLTPPGRKRLQEWDSPWGRGFPGWHIECSAIIRTLLGQEIDIHTGGMDHITVHHNNEIAQSEAISGRTFVRYWLHNAFLTMSGEKIAKSLGNVVTLPEVVQRGHHPLSLRYFFLQAHYRTPISFSWDALGAAEESLKGLVRAARLTRGAGFHSERDYLERFRAAMYDDLNTPKALGILWDLAHDRETSFEEREEVFLLADRLLGLSLTNPPPAFLPLPRASLPKGVQSLLVERDKARKERDFQNADRIRADLSKRGYRVEDGPEETLLFGGPE